MNMALETPSGELARRILSTAPYDQRFRVGRLIPPVGLTSSHVRGLHEFHSHLAPDIRSLPGVNLNALPEWISSTFGDVDLAQGVRAIVGESTSYVEKCQSIHELIGQRLDQAAAVLAEKGSE
jgi:hypothetical protein